VRRSTLCFYLLGVYLLDSNELEFSKDYIRIIEIPSYYACGVLQRESHQSLLCLPRFTTAMFTAWVISQVEVVRCVNYNRESSLKSVLFFNLFFVVLKRTDFLLVLDIPE
jgi:hypothetical protein